MDEKRLNVSQICSITVYLKAKNRHYEYRKESGMWFWKTKEGFYWTYTIGSPILLTKERIEQDKELYCENQTVYFKPHIDIRMSNQALHTKYFEKPSDIQDFLSSEEMRKTNWINVLQRELK